MNALASADSVNCRFLLNYVSRDEVALLNRGTGGVPDVRNAVDGYEEASPLYGFLQYRRRKVILSYIPEDTSRLVKGVFVFVCVCLLGCIPALNGTLVQTDAILESLLARTTVQFQSVLDRFSPHDTVFSLSKSSDLTESALSSACLLHTASGSITSSSSSLRRRRLMEITEDAEENATTDNDAKSPASELPPHRPFSQRSDATVMAPPRTPSSLHQSTSVNDQIPETNAPDVPSTNSQPSPPHPAPSALDQSPGHSTYQTNLRDDVSLAPSESRRYSQQSSRASLRDVDYSTAYTPKVKRGPRPSVDSNGRPRTAGNLSRGPDQRPVAALPAGIRSSALRRPTPNNPSRPRSQGSPVASSSISGSSKGAPPVPPLLVPPLSMPISRPHISPGAKSLSAVSASGMSPEKERLMKALQQRKKQMEKRTGQNKQNQPAAAEKTGQDTDENKENLGSGRLNINHDEKGAADRTAAVNNNNNNSEQGTTEPPTIPTTESRKEAQPFFSTGQSKPDSAVDLVVSDSDGDQPSNTTSPPSTTPTTTATTLSIDLNNHNNNDDDVDDYARKETEEEELQTPRPFLVPEPESDASQKTTPPVDASSENEDGPRSSTSAVVDDPLENKSRKAPENEIVISPPPTIQPPSLGAQEEEAPETTSQPDAPSIADSSSSTVFSNGPDPQHDSPAPEHSDAVRQDVIARKERRKPFLEPIQVPTPEYSDDDNLLSDDSFMEELKSATVQEAKPVSVGKSPLSPAYPNNGQDQASSPEAWKNSRAVSNPTATMETQSSPNLHAVTEGRSVSSTYPDANDPMSPVLVARKVNVSSGISKRIKALEKFTGGPEAPAATSTPPNLAVAPSSFDTFRKRTSISKGSPSISRTPSYSADLSPKSEGLSRDDSRASVNGTQTTGSVSVTAQIVRDSDGGSPDPSLGLQASPLKVEHETFEVPQSQGLTAESAADEREREKRSMSTSSAGSGNQSQTATVPRSDSRMSISSQSKGEGGSQSKAGGDQDERRGSRTSRLLHRVSSITTNSRRSLLGALSPSPSFKEEDAASVPEKEPEPAPETTHQAVDIGEVNVQFPDTLLWKRRFVRVDEKGYLVLTPANVDSSGRNMTKRYHMTEFRTPCLPDEDRQELPNSILLDFLDGSTLQCACESRQGQAAVLDSESPHCP